jgi:hemoglobin
MKTDIGSRADIEKLVMQFYELVKADETIGFIFTELVPMNWEKHIPLIVDFWETILLDNPVYTKNAMEVHFDLNKRIPLQKEHFNSWVHLFTTTVDNLFEGKKASLAKTRAKSIAGLMLFKMPSRITQSDGENTNKGL